MYGVDITKDARPAKKGYTHLRRKSSDAGARHPGAWIGGHERQARFAVRERFIRYSRSGVLMCCRRLP